MKVCCGSHMAGKDLMGSWGPSPEVPAPGHRPCERMFCSMQYRYSPQTPAASMNSSCVMLHSCSPLMLKWQNEMQLVSSLYCSQQNWSHSQTWRFVQYSGWTDVQYESHATPEEREVRTMALRGAFERPPESGSSYVNILTLCSMN